MTFLVDGTNGGTFPSWTTATRPASPAVGQMGYNTTTGLFDMYTASGWVSSLTNASQSIPFAALPTGSVLQVVQATYSTEIALSSPSPFTVTATGLSASITPKFSTSKILVLTSNSFWFQNATSVALYGHFNLYKNTSTLVFGAATADQVVGSVTEFGGRVNLTYLDSPATTSSTSYSVSFVNDMQPTTLKLNRNSNPATILLMEIAA